MLLVLVPVVVLAAVVLARRNHEPARQALLLRRLGLGLSVVAAVFFASFAVGDTVVDPGGWRAVRLVALWGGPLVAVCALAWWRPRPATAALAVLVAVVIALSAWYAADPEAWRSLEDRHGPVRALLTFELGAALALLGVKRTAVAGALLLALGLGPLVLGSRGQITPITLLAAGSAPVVTGVLYLLSARLARRGPPGRPPAARPASASGR